MKYEAWSIFVFIILVTVSQGEGGSGNNSGKLRLLSDTKVMGRFSIFVFFVLKKISSLIYILLRWSVS